MDSAKDPRDGARRTRRPQRFLLVWHLLGYMRNPYCGSLPRFCAQDAACNQPLGGRGDAPDLNDMTAMAGLTQ